MDSVSSNSDVEEGGDSSDTEDLYHYNRQGQLERSNSITLEQKENEAKERIINIFSMRSKIQKWKNNTASNDVNSTQVNKVKGKQCTS